LLKIYNINRQANPVQLFHVDTPTDGQTSRI